MVLGALQVATWWATRGGAGDGGVREGERESERENERESDASPVFAGGGIIGVVLLAPLLPQQQVPGGSVY